MKKRPTQSKLASSKRPRRLRRATAPRADGGAPQTRVQPRIEPRWAWHYKVLVGLRDRLIERESEKLREACEPIEPHSMHDADSATDEFDHDLALTFLAADQSALTEISDAIQRIVEGTYGTCQATGVRLPKERLRAIPWCRYSREEEERLEQKGEVRYPRVPRVYSIGGAEEGLAKPGETAEAPGEAEAGALAPETAAEALARGPGDEPGGGAEGARRRKPERISASGKRT